MPLFYQINFAQRRQARNRKVWAAAWIVLAGVLLFAGAHLKYLHEESQKPVLQPRLAELQMHVLRVEECVSNWTHTYEAYQTIRPFIEKQTSASGSDVLVILEKIIDGVLTSTPDEPTLRMKPGTLLFTRGVGLELTVEVPLPSRDKKTYMRTLNESVGASVKRALEESNSALTNAQVKINWKSESPTVNETQNHLTIAIAFPKVNGESFPEVPRDLKETDLHIKPLRELIYKRTLKFENGKEDTVGKTVAAFHIPPDAAFADLKRLQGSFVDPLHLTSELRKRIPDKYMNAGYRNTLDQFEHAWRDISYARWYRDKTLDNEELDDLVDAFKRFSAALPRQQEFTRNREKIEAYLCAFTNGVRTKHIMEENTFWDWIVVPAVQQASDKRLRAERVGNPVVNITAPCVDFPVWKIKLVTCEAGASGLSMPTQKTAATMLSLSQLGLILNGFETNPSGTWITHVKASFDVNSGSAEHQWKTVGDVELEGRVPCWTKKEE